MISLYLSVREVPKIRQHVFYGIVFPKTKEKIYIVWFVALYSDY